MKLCRHFPDFLSLVTANQLTPVPALVFLGALSLVYLTTSDVYRCLLKGLLSSHFRKSASLLSCRLIDYAAFVESMFILVMFMQKLVIKH